jgi:hypothetical protein
MFAYLFGRYMPNNHGVVTDNNVASLEEVNDIDIGILDSIREILIDRNQRKQIC